jgi:ubiquitin-protein ligase
MALRRLRSEYEEWLKENKTDKPQCYSIYPDETNFFNWKVMLFLPDDTIFEGHILNCSITFSNSYPNKPPIIIFENNKSFIHPNIYKDGKICISILHEGIDETEYENQSERWNPSHSVDSILISIISVLCEPNLESPANLDAAILWRNDLTSYKKLVYESMIDN